MDVNIAAGSQVIRPTPSRDGINEYYALGIYDAVLTSLQIDGTIAYMKNLVTGGLSTLTNMDEWFRDRTDITKFYSDGIDTSLVTSFSLTWSGCTNITSFPVLDVSGGTDFSSAWSGCSSLTSFPVLDVSGGTGFIFTWRDCSSLTSFPVLDVSGGTSFSSTWRDCSSLTSFPAHRS